MKATLEKEEKEILESFENGEWVPVTDFPNRKKALVERTEHLEKRQETEHTDLRKRSP